MTLKIPFHPNYYRMAYYPPVLKLAPFGRKLVQRAFAPMAFRNTPIRRITTLLPLGEVPAPLQTSPAV